jgi:hypothetical protein
MSVLFEPLVCAKRGVVKSRLMNRAIIPKRSFNITYLPTQNNGFNYSHWEAYYRKD